LATVEDCRIACQALSKSCRLSANFIENGAKIASLAIFRGQKCFSGAISNKSELIRIYFEFIVVLLSIWLSWLRRVKTAQDFHGRIEVDADAAL
jgi:hypothetical protein